MDQSLEKYHQKRNFRKTSEPRGKKEQSTSDLRFVVQHHLSSREHYDFRLEYRGVLLSWAVPKGPSFNPQDKRLAAHVEDHPLEYRNFEGNIPVGQYGGGPVMIWDEGYYHPEIDMRKGLKDGSLKFTLHGKRLKGSWTLIKMKTPQKGDNWLLVKHRDQYSKKTSGISRFTTSVRTQRSMKEIIAEKECKKGNPFTKTEVQLAKLTNEVPEGKKWIYEVKYDGYRMLGYVENNTALLISRNGHRYNKYFQEIAASLVDFANGRPMVVDGEIVAFDNEGKPNFQLLQNYLKSPKNHKIGYLIFDLLALDGRDLRQEKLLTRKQTLKSLFSPKTKNIFFSARVFGHGQENFKAVEESGLEGLICKKTDSFYLGGRSGDWLKVKCTKSQEFIICGYTLSSLQTLKSLILGYYQNGKIIYAGRVGTGFSQGSSKEIKAKLESLTRKTPTIKDLSLIKKNNDIIWVTPKLLAEIAFTEWTKDHVLRHPSFKGLRIDKSPLEVVKEEKETLPKKGTINITNTAKIIYPALKLTKGDVINYYQKVQERMLPYLKNRLLSLVVCPQGIKGKSFFKKHLFSSSKYCYPKKVKNAQEKEYFYIKDKQGIIFLTQNNALEFHIWGSSIKNIDKPNILVFDLDPDEKMDLKKVRQGAKDLRTVLASLKLISFLKTSGGKGYHIVVPLKEQADYKTVRDFSKNVAFLLEQKWPERYTINLRKEKRKNKIFIDWMRNIKGATSVAPYSLRARENAPVSFPIPWSQISKISPADITIHEALQKISNKDPWVDFFKVGEKQSIKKTK